MINTNMFSSNSCATCGDSITDPICRNCYIKQTQILLQDLKINPMIKNFIFNKIKKEYPIDTLNDTECILCKKESVTLCRYCFSVILMKILSEINFPEDLIEIFRYKSPYVEITPVDLAPSSSSILL